MTRLRVPWSAVWGPGLLVMLADTDAGNIVAAAQAGTQWGYRLLALPLVLIPALIMVQELATRIGLVSGAGVAAMARRHFGGTWAGFAAIALIASTLASLVTELDGIAGVGALFGVPRWLVVPPAALALLGVILGGGSRRAGVIALVVGLFELSFFAVAWTAHPRLADMVADLGRQPIGEPAYLYLAAALIGATFNPWMIFYQPAALLEKGLGRVHLTAARWDTAAGALLTQLATAAVLIAAAATLGRSQTGAGLSTVGQISGALTPFLGQPVGRSIFGLGVVGASVAAAIVCSLALLGGLRDICSGATARFVYVGCVAAGAVTVLAVPDLLALAVAAQVANALLMPGLLGLLVALSTKCLPRPDRLHGVYLWVVATTCGLAALGGLAGAIAALF